MPVCVVHVLPLVVSLQLLVIRDVMDMPLYACQISDSHSSFISSYLNSSCPCRQWMDTFQFVLVIIFLLLVSNIVVVTCPASI
ncbi:hypothetical protein V1520DRAFT_334206 [Lipomyces starkeyi]